MNDPGPSFEELNELRRKAFPDDLEWCRKIEVRRLARMKDRR